MRITFEQSSYGLAVIAASFGVACGGVNLGSNDAEVDLGTNDAGVVPRDACDTFGAGCSGPDAGSPVADATPTPTGPTGQGCGTRGAPQCPANLTCIYAPAANCGSG